MPSGLIACRLHIVKKKKKKKVQKNYGMTLLATKWVPPCSFNQLIATSNLLLKITGERLLVAPKVTAT